MLYKHTATELSAMLKAKKITTVELINDIFDRIEKT